MYGSPPQVYHSRLYDQENSDSFRRPSFYTSDDPDWEPYDEGLIPTRKSKVTFSCVYWPHASCIMLMNKKHLVNTYMARRT